MTKSRAKVGERLPYLLSKLKAPRVLQRLEQTARELGHRRVALTSTFTAHDFYLAAGYADDGTQTAYETGDWPHMQKELA